MFRFLIVLITAFVLAGCSLKPNIEYSNSVVPAEFKHGTSSEEYVKPSWEEFVKNDKLQELIRLALKNNRDLKIAILNVESTRANYRIARSKYLPSVDARASSTNARELIGNDQAAISRTQSARIGASYELDMFGKTKSLSDSALNSYLATKYAVASAQTSLISEVVNLWNNLASNLDHQKLLEQTIDNLKQNLELAERKFDLGITPIDDVYSTQTSLKAAEINLLNHQVVIEKNRSSLDLLISTDIPDHLLPTNFEESENSLMVLDATISSKVLLSRPDILESEHNLKAKNANIGAARAAFFPSISLTADYGLASNSLSSLFEGKGKSVWSFVPSINIPIFRGGENRANLDYANSEQKIALAQYEKAIQLAFKDVSDVLFEKSHIKSQLTAQEELVNIANSSYEKAVQSYKYGLGNYLNVLVAQKSLFDAQMALIDAKLNESVNRVQLYVSLGGSDYMKQGF